jgi:4-amino-4-deoxy-L-arabinose transferase-like glycosyltransferase
MGGGNTMTGAAAQGVAQSQRGWRWATVAFLAAILGVAFWLRWTYATDTSPYVDEYITLRAAQQILDRGLPLLPTGNFYSHGLLLSYLEAGVMAVAGFSSLAARLPVVVLSLLAVAATWWVGRQWFSTAVGLLAAALLAFTPEAIVWSGRARMYGPLPLFALLALFFGWRSLAHSAEPGTGAGRWRNAGLFAVSFLGALYLHAEAMILLPILALIALALAWPKLRKSGSLRNAASEGAAVLRGWWRAGLIAAWIAAGLGVLVELWFRQLGPPMVSRLAEGVYGTSGRLYLQPAWDWPGIRKTLEPLLSQPAVLGLAGALMVGLVAFGLQRRRSARALLPAGWRAPLFYLAAVVGLALVVLLFLTDPSWKSPRYLVMLLPAFYLALAAAAWALAEHFLRGQWGRWTVLSVGLLLMAAGSWPAAWAAAHEEVAGYDRAFEYVAAQWQPGDGVMTFVPQAAILYLGRSDYVSVPTDYRGFAYEQDGRWLESWDGVPMVDSAAGVSEALRSTASGAVAAQERLWFVVDEHRFHNRFAPGFAQAVWDGMDLVWRSQQVLVFCTADPPAPKARVERQATLGPLLLMGYALEGLPEPGADLPLTLYWSADAVPGAAYSASLRLVDGSGVSWAQDDGPPLGEVYPTTSWRPGEVLRDRRVLALPAGLPPGLYRLDVATLAPLAQPERADRATVGFVRVGEPEALPPGLTAVDALFGGQIRLLGYAVTPAAGGRGWSLTLAWKAEASVDADYTVFVHLVDATGEIRGQQDGPPGGGFYPTSYWKPGEIVVDRHDLSLADDAPAGTYRLWVGLYQLASGERLSTAAGDTVELDRWTVP